MCRMGRERERERERRERERQSVRITGSTARD